MTLTLRIVLLLMSVSTCIWILTRIRKSQAKIADSVFWLLFSGLLILMSLFPQLIEWGARLSGVQTPVNFVFLSIIFVLIVKLFRMSVKISQLESKLQSLVQTYAIDRLDSQSSDNHTN